MSNNNNNTEETKRDWKIYISLFLYALLGLAIGYAIAKGSLYFYNRPKTGVVKVVDDASMMGAKDFAATVSSDFEGKNIAAVTFKNSSDLTVTQGTAAKTKYFYVTNASGTNVATIYMSYEGGRGYSAANYIAEVIAKFVPSISAPSSVSYASTSWLYVSAAASEWHVAPVRDGEWLVVVENKKSNHDAMTSVYETLMVK